ncbi:site-2 protease family protein [Robertmurraya yapensis]|uniref:Site-2 protease family protein n=1 Tax=Bacillus yapensis TaxID=2492960 RepID=A0A431WCJ5_9BACI|nr:site-2 protease family protein [Bacillus yapensis]RTR33038.1 site-2 protease family protein [Bacillus yapensis]TKS96861.1 site-2 protease family protein [Bacillus yapensis]
MENLANFLAFPLEQLPYVIITLIIAFTVHEFAHAYVAYRFGDSTAKKQGRLTLNPIQHLDPIGTILLFIAGFGWARPVPVNRFFFKNPRLAGILVSVAGPLSNLIMACLGFIIWYGLVGTGLAEGMSEFVPNFLDTFIYLNMLLFVFNLLPFPPLDGYRIIEDLVPGNIRPKMTQFEQYGSLIFLILVITPLDQYTIQPILSTLIPFFMDGLNSFFYNLLT